MPADKGQEQEWCARRTLLETESSIGPVQVPCFDRDGTPTPQPVPGLKNDAFEQHTASAQSCLKSMD